MTNIDFAKIAADNNKEGKAQDFTLNMSATSTSDDNEQLSAIMNFPSKEDEGEVSPIQSYTEELTGNQIPPNAQEIQDKKEGKTVKEKEIVQLVYPYILVELPIPDKLHPKMVSFPVLASGSKGLTKLLINDAEKNELREKEKNKIFAQIEKYRENMVAEVEENLRPKLQAAKTDEVIEYLTKFKDSEIERNYKEYLMKYMKKSLPSVDCTNLDSNTVYNMLLAYYSNNSEIDMKELGGVNVYITYPTIARTSDGRDTYIKKTVPVISDTSTKMTEYKATRFLPTVIQSLFTPMVKLHYYKVKGNKPIDLLDVNKVNVTLDLGCGGYYADENEMMEEVRKELSRKNEMF